MKSCKNNPNVAEIRSERMLLRKSAERLDQSRVATNLHFIEILKKLSMKCNRAKCNKMRVASIAIQWIILGAIKVFAKYSKGSHYYKNSLKYETSAY